MSLDSGEERGIYEGQERAELYLDINPFAHLPISHPPMNRLFQMFLQRPAAARGESVRKGGFSLVETMMGSVVMTMVLAGAFSALSQGSQLANRARNEQMVDQLLKNEVQFLKTLAFDSFDTVDRVFVPGSTTQLYLAETSFTVAETEKLFTGQTFTKSVGGTTLTFVGRPFFQGEFPLIDAQLSVVSTNYDNNDPTERKELVYTLTWKEVDGRVMTREVEFLFCKNGIFDSFATTI